jgi:hypothetical protein
MEVRFGSKPEVTALKRGFCFYFNNGHVTTTACPKGADTAAKVFWG